MKLRHLIHTLLLAFVGILVIPQTAPAQTIIRVSGAGTYRAPFIKAVESLLVNSGPDQYKFGYTGTNRYRATASIYSGKLASNGQSVTIEFYTAGDASGVINFTSQIPINWLKTDASTLALLTTSGTSNLSNGLIAESAVADANLSVSFASSTAAVFSTAGAAGATAAANVLAAPLVDSGTPALAGGAQTLGIAAFEWVLGRWDTAVFPTQPFTNITQSTAAAVTQGPVPVSYFTGNPADKFRWVFAVGRTQDGGARTVPIAETGLGFKTPSYFFQLQFLNNGTAQVDGLPTGGAGATVSRITPWPANSPLITLPQINWNLAGNSGYNVVSDLANALSAKNPVNVTVGTTPVANTVLINPADAPSGVTQAWFVGNNAIGDTDALVAAGGRRLSYNGVSYSPDAVRSGQYPVWSFAHLYRLASGPGAISGVKLNVVNAIADAVYQTYAPTNQNGVTDPAPTNTGAAGILFDSSVLVTRSVEGGTIFTTY